MGINGQSETSGAPPRASGVLTIERGCRRELVRLALVVLTYHVVLRFVLSLPSDFVLGSTLILSIFGFFLLNALIIWFIPGPEVRALVRAEAGSAPEDGQVAAVSGPVVSLGEPLRSPLQGARCCAYEYKIMRPDVDAEGNPTAYKDFRGFAYAPCAIRTPGGNVTLMGLSFSSLHAFEERNLLPYKTRKLAARYIGATTFSAEPLSSLATTREALQDLTDPAQPAGRWDYCQKDAKLSAKHFFFETTLAAGRHVTAIGLYSAEGQSLVSRETIVLQLMPGDLSASRKRLRGHAGGALLMAIAMFAFSHGVFLFLMLTGAFE